MSFGATIRQRRHELNIGLNEFAERLGISATYWSRIERDQEKPPRDDLIERAAAILVPHPVSWTRGCTMRRA